MSNGTIVSKPKLRLKSSTWALHKEKYMMILPFAAIFLLTAFIPVALSIYLSFTDFNIAQLPDFIGLQNYMNLMIRDTVFLTAIKNTLVLAIVTGPISYLMCFIFAWLINELPRFPRAIMTLVFYAPSISGNAFIIWSLIFSSDAYGYANAWLMRLGLINEPILWFTTEQYIIPILIVVTLWMSLGISFLSFIAGLQGVDRSLFEAGSIDGIRNRWQELWFITLPSMKPMLMFGAVMQITASLSSGNISLSLMGFPTINYAGHTIVTHLHDFGNVRYEMGYASAIATVLFMIMLVANIIVQKILRRVGQ